MMTLADTSKFEIEKKSYGGQKIIKGLHEALEHAKSSPPMTDTTELRKLAVSSLDAAINFRTDNTTENLKIAADAQDKFNDAANEVVVLALLDRLEKAESENANLLLQAKSWAMEAKGQRSTVNEINQAVSGASGEKADWNGARPAIDELAKLRDENKALREALSLPTIEFHQWDWIEGFAAFVDDGQKFNPESKAFCVLNLGSLLAAIETKDMPQSELPYHIADSMMHEITHVIEKWCGVEFSEERVVALRDKYRNAAKAMEQQND